MKKHRKFFYNILAVTLFLVTILLYISLFDHHYKSQISEIENSGYLLKGIIDYGSDVRTYFIHAMKLLAEETLDNTYEDFLDRNLAIPLSLKNEIVPMPDKGGYGSPSADVVSPYRAGRISGAGELPVPLSPRAAEINMALRLTPLFRSVFERYSDTTWVYYISLDHFIYLYPAIDHETFFYSDQLYESDPVRSALPHANSKGYTVWSDVYMDDRGKGILMALFIFLALFIDRPFCRYFCVEGAPHGLLSLGRLFSIKRNKELCVDCKLCDHICPMQVKVSRGGHVRNPQCNNCFKCIEKCPCSGALRYS